MKHAIMPIIIWLLNLFDCICTVIGTNKLGTDIEVNPLVRALLPFPILLFIVKVGIVTITCVLIYKTRQHKIIQIATWLLLAVYVGVAVHNIHLLITLAKIK